MNKILLTLASLLLISNSLYASKPLVGIAEIKNANPGTINISRLLESHLLSVIKFTGVFEVVNHALLKEELIKFNCIEEDCLLSFAKNAGLQLLINGHLEDRTEEIVLNLYAYGIDAPYYGKIIYKYRASVPLKIQGRFIKGHSFIYEEHVAYFISNLLKSYKEQAFIKIGLNNEIEINKQSNANGDYTIYRYNKVKSDSSYIRLYSKIGLLRVEKNRIEVKSLDVEKIAVSDFIFLSYIDEAEFLQEFYYERKKEIVFDRPSIRDTLFTMLFTIPGSALMPMIVPMGYYSYGDFKGFSLWALNSLPYLYLEYDGLVNRPEVLRDDKKDISKKSITRYHFGLYMLLAGGMSLFVDAFSHQSIALSSNYQARQPILGNSITAAYLSLICGGGGHFYRGYRIWGYSYFHINNIL